MTQDQALNILKTGASVFLTGEPGSGKTHTVNAYVSWLKSHGIEPAITASTGIAATHIGGMTIHSFSGIGIAEYLSDYDVDRIASTERIQKRVMATSILIIDEVSMLAANTLQMVDAVFRAVRNSEMPFGGVQVILVGDFFQLPPVKKDGQSAGFAFESQLWTTLNPVVCYLTEQHRQEDPGFLEVLTAIRRNQVSESHREVFTSRHVNFTQLPKDVPKLFPHNADVDRINELELKKLPSEEMVFEMTTQGRKALVEQMIRGCLSPETLKLKNQATVMFTKNDKQGRFVNGTLGIVVDVDPETNYPVVKTKQGAVITAVPTKWSIEEGGKVLAFIEQIPLRLAWAITVHKSQGMSMDAATMDLSKAFEYGQGYVALSRVRTLAGLFLVGMNERALQVHPNILEMDASFREASVRAEEYLAKLPGELQSLQEKFIRACGGTLEVKEVEPAAQTYMEKVREAHPNAGKKWDVGQEIELKKLFAQNFSIQEMSEKFGRKPGGIRSRLVKMGLIEE